MCAKLFCGDCVIIKSHMCVIEYTNLYIYGHISRLSEDHASMSCIMRVIH